MSRSIKEYTVRMESIRRLLTNKSDEMNTYHTEPRPGCRKFAPCGKISLHKCRKYKGKLEECKGCTLVKRKAKNITYVQIGQKVCPHCGRSLPLHRFYTRIIKHNDKEYHCLTSWCKMCMSEAAKIRNQIKIRNSYEENSSIG